MVMGSTRVVPGGNMKRTWYRNSLWVVPVEGSGTLAPGVVVCSAIAAVFRWSVDREPERFNKSAVGV